MSTPKLREGAMGIIDNASESHAGHVWDKTGDSHSQFSEQDGFITGARWALANLDKLLEPRQAPLVNGKRVAFVEVEGE